VSKLRLTATQGRIIRALLFEGDEDFVTLAADASVRDLEQLDRDLRTLFSAGLISFQKWVGKPPTYCALTPEEVVSLPPLAELIPDPVPERVECVILTPKGRAAAES
jgi:predicted transcriptional regulator